MRTLALAALLALAASAAHAQETPPPATGPYLLLQQEDDVLVLAAMGERRPTASGASVTTVAFLRQDGDLLRGEALTEADCDRAVRRTGPIFIQLVETPDVRVAPVTSVPGVDWSPFAVEDGPLKAYLCEDGRHDPTTVSPRPSTFVTPWLAAAGG